MKPLIAMLALAVAAAPAAAQRPGIASAANKHNLSTTGPGPIKSATVTEICVFCHAPHNTRPQRPLWNQELSGEAFTPYASSTIAAQPGQPTGASKLCLSCHDGTVAMGRTMNGGTLSLSGTDQGRLPVGSPSIIGTNLSNDHPISFAPVPGPQITMPPQGDAVALDRNGQLQCTSCHDPHEQDRDQTTRKFLVKSNQASGLCVTCHRKDYWGSNPSTHKTSTTTYDAALGAHTGYTTVSNNGCESCHKPHAAGWPARLLKQDEAQTCGTAAAQCHGGRIPTTKNIYQEMNGTKTVPASQLQPDLGPDARRGRVADPPVEAAARAVHHSQPARRLLRLPQPARLVQSARHPPESRRQAGRGVGNQVRP